MLTIWHQQRLMSGFFRNDAYKRFPDLGIILDDENQFHLIMFIYWNFFMIRHLIELLLAPGDDYHTTHYPPFYRTCQLIPSVSKGSFLRHLIGKLPIQYQTSSKYTQGSHVHHYFITTL